MKRFAILAGILIVLTGLTACSPAGASEGSQSLVLYSGRSESLVGPIIEQFEEASGIDVQVKWGSTPELAATLLEEGANSPADVFFAQDPGGLGAVQELLRELPDETLGKVQSNFRDPQGMWVGTSGRAGAGVQYRSLEPRRPARRPGRSDGSGLARTYRLGADQCLLPDHGDSHAATLGR